MRSVIFVQRSKIRFSAGVFFLNDCLFTCCSFEKENERLIMLAYELWAGVHDEVKFFAEEFVFAGDRHVVYDAAGVVMLNAAFV